MNCKYIFFCPCVLLLTFPATSVCKMHLECVWHTVCVCYTVVFICLLGALPFLCSCIPSEQNICLPIFPNRSVCRISLLRSCFTRCHEDATAACAVYKLHINSKALTHDPNSARTNINGYLQPLAKQLVPTHLLLASSVLKAVSSDGHF